MPDRSPSTAEADALSWQQTRALIRSDFERLVAWYGGGSFARRVYWFLLPNYQALFFYRLYRHLYLKGWRSVARLLFLFSLYLTGCEISPTTSIGPACLITHAFGVILFGKIGARFAVYGQGGTGGGFDVTDIGAGPGYPVIGDDVVFGIKAFALGAISVGDRVRVGPGALVVSDVPADAVVMPVPAKVLKVRIASSLTAEESESVAP